MVPAGMTESLMMTTMPSLITHPCSSLFASFTPSLLMIWQRGPGRVQNRGSNTGISRLCGVIL